MSETLRERCERLRHEMHEAPMNKMFKDHTGHRFLGSHSMAWAQKSREWAAARREFELSEKGQ
jgi:hypothetical protein